jgi:hypothetical protein
MTDPVKCPWCGYVQNSPDCARLHVQVNATLGVARLDHSPNPSVFVGPRGIEDPNALRFDYKPATTPCGPCEGVGYFIWHVSGNRGRITCDTCAGTGRVF